MDMKKYITLVESAAKPLEVKAKPVQPKTEPQPTVHISESYESSAAIRKIVRNIMEKKNPPQPPKQRNPVAKNANAAVGGGAAGKHKDKKKDAKQGVQKHKGQQLDEYFEREKPTDGELLLLMKKYRLAKISGKPLASVMRQSDIHKLIDAEKDGRIEALKYRDSIEEKQQDEDNTGSTDKGEFKRRELEHELGHETRSGEVYIDGKYWKTFDTFKQAQNVARSLERKGKRATARMLESKKPKKTAQEKLSAAVDKERKKNEPATRRAKQELDAAMPSKALAEGRVCPQCGSSKCSCPPGKCKCKPVAGFKPKMKEDKDPCWKNYKMVGTKKKGSKTVPNCVPKESRVGENTDKPKTMSRAAKGNEKYGKDGMKALAKAGREGKDLDKIRDKYNKYDEAANPAQQAAIAIAKKKKKAVAEDIRTKADFRREIDDTVTDFLNKGGKIKEVPPNKVRVKPGQSLASKHIGSKIEAGRVVGKDRKINSKQPVVSTEHMGETQLDELDRPSGKLYIIITADNAGAPHVFGDFGSFPQDVMHKIAKRGTRDKSGAKTKLKIDFLFDDFRTTLQQLRAIFRDLDFIGAEAAEFIIKSSALRSDQGEDVKQLIDYIQAGDDRRMKIYQAPGDDEEDEPTGGNILRIDPKTGAARRVVGVKPQTQMGGHAVAQPTTFKYTLLKTELMPKLRDMGFKFDGNQIILRAEQRDKLKNMLGAQFQSVFGQKGTFKEGGEKYKIKTTGSDINPATGKRADYYISPNTGKKVYKKANVGDHESPNSGEHKPKVEGQIARAIMKEFGLT
jgi:hypothetical protein